VDFIGKNLLEFLSPESHALVLKQMQLETVKSYEVQCIRKDGSVFPVETSTQTYKAGDRIIRATSVRDITERKRLEQQIQTAFERRGNQVQLSTQVSQSIAAATSLEDLYQRVVTQVKERFGYYHTQILRYYADQDAVVLITGYGEIGEKMLAAGHHLPMGEGLIGTAASTGDTLLRSTLENDPDWHPNPLLPDTKGEIAVPIKLGDNILGVLDVQSNVAGTLGADDQLLLEGLCGQVAIAIESTRLRQEMTDRLEEINRLYRAMSHEGWQAYRETADFPTGFMYDQAGTRQVDTGGLTKEFFSKIPLTVLGGEVIGTLSVADDPQRPISPEDQNFLQQISEQVTLALESARLFEQTQAALSEVARRADELNTLNQIITTASQTLDLNTILDAVLDKVLVTTNFSAGLISITKTGTDLLEIGAIKDMPQVIQEKLTTNGLGGTLCAYVAETKQHMSIEDLARGGPVDVRGLIANGLRSYLGVPIVGKGRVLGTLCLFNSAPREISKELLDLVDSMAKQTGIAIENARLYAEQTATVTQLRELDRLKSAFLANMSHELRTPLNSILGFSDVMLEEIDGPLTEPMNNDLQLIQKNGQHLLHLINDVLDMAKIEAGRINLSPERFRVHEILDDVLSITSTLASEKNLSLFVEEDSGNDVEIFADRTRLRQVMINLINNSIKFTESGKIAIRAARQGTENILICVRDTGVGIPPDKLEAIFQEFAQIDTSSTRKAGGTGLGLPISRRLIELHGGRLWAESNGIPGEGSIFYVELPIEARIVEPIEKLEK
jgi:signal transduction histidine kinase/putative methionine-R-sulfoxide reductase with GAF domain